MFNSAAVYCWSYFGSRDQYVIFTRDVLYASARDWATSPILVLLRYGSGFGGTTWDLR